MIIMRATPQHVALLVTHYLQQRGRRSAAWRGVVRVFGVFRVRLEVSASGRACC